MQFYCVNINPGPNWITVMSSWPSGAVVKVLACHAGGCGFEPPLEHFFFYYYKKIFFSSSIPIQTSFHCIILLLFFSYLHKSDFFHFY